MISERFESLAQAFRVFTEQYLLVDFAAGAGEEGGSFAQHYVAWSDILIVLAEQSKKYGANVAATLPANLRESPYFVPAASFFAVQH